MQRQVATRVHSRSKHECSLAEEQEATYKLLYCITVHINRPTVTFMSHGD